MSLPAIIMLAVVLLVGVPSAVRISPRERPRVTLLNPTAAALVIAWLVPEWWWLRSGDSLPVHLYFYTDLFVMFVLCAKAWVRRATAWDIAIMAIFPVMWLYYFDGQIGAAHKWYALFLLTLAQFLAAGADPFFAWLEPRAANTPATASRQKPDTPSAGREYRWTRGRTGYA